MELNTKHIGTIPEIAGIIQEHPDRVRYAIGRYGINEIDRIAGARVFSFDQLDAIKKAVSKVRPQKKRRSLV